MFRILDSSRLRCGIADCPARRRFAGGGECSKACCGDNECGARGTGSTGVGGEDALACVAKIGEGGGSGGLAHGGGQSGLDCDVGDDVGGKAGGDGGGCAGGESKSAVTWQFLDPKQRACLPAFSMDTRRPGTLAMSCRVQSR